jgi:aminoglycoside phosphotransferase family enzyme/predicted kinase
MNQAERVVSFLSSPGAYPHPTGRIEQRETHVSHVFLAGRFAYKLKKPVKFPFLDASTLASRKKFCELELTLNRRLAPKVYIGLVPVTSAGGELQLGGKGRVVEWVVKMHRLPEQRMLDRLVASRRVRPAEIRQIADILARFFRKAGRSRRIDWYGKPEQVRALVLGNLEECRLFLGKLYSEESHARLEAAYHQFLALHEPVLAARVREKRIIDGHGDLRCENICMTKPANVFDCVEFQPAFRCGDMANDVSFLIMDLEFRGRHDLAKIVADRYQALLKDRAGRLLPFYQCHRSLVRGKVRGFAWLQHPDTKHGRAVQDLARRHFELAGKYARQFAPPRVVVVGGLIGTGKSTLASGLASALKASWLRTDEIRLREFAHHRQNGQGFSEGLYAPSVSDQVYQRLLKLADEQLAESRSIVCDGTFSRNEGRNALAKLSAKHNASFYYFECWVPKAVAMQRISRRAALGKDLSGAKPEHYEQLKAGFEPVQRLPRGGWSRISDHRRPERTLQAALAILRTAWVIKGV